jgi:FkbM family methyltransferase
MDIELALWRSVTTRLPSMRGPGILARIARETYCRKPRPEVVVDVQGNVMRLDPNECVDSGILISPQLFDWREIKFLKSNLAPNGTFLDIGANIGFYSIILARHMGAKGKAFAFEADPSTFEILKENIELNPLLNINAINYGVSDLPEKLMFYRNTPGNRGGNSLIQKNPDAKKVEVMCKPLLDILGEYGIDRVDAAKIDIEGMEYRVLKAFFNDAPESLFPKALVLEYQPEWLERMGGDPVSLLLENGYKIEQQIGINVMLSHV